MDRSRRFVFNSICTAVMQMSAILCGFITNRLILSAYSTETSGFVMSVIQYSSHFTVAVAGITGAASYALYAPLAAGDYKTANGILTTAGQYYKYVGFAAFAVNTIIAFLYPVFISSELTAAFIRAVIITTSISVVLEISVISRFNTLLSSDQRTHVLSLASTASYVAQTIAVYAFSRANASALYICIAYLIAAGLRGVAMWRYARRHYPAINYRGTPERDWAKLQKHALYVNILYFLLSVLPIAFITVYTNLESVRTYSTYNIVIVGLQAVLSIFVFNITPAFGNIIACDEKQTLAGSYRIFELAFYTFTAFICATAAAVITDFIRLYTAGIENADFESPETGLLFILNLMFLALQIPQTSVLQARGMYKEIKRPAEIQFAMFWLLSVLFAPKYGINGVLIACVCANMYRSIRTAFFLPVMVQGYRIVRNLFLQGAAVSAVLLSYVVYKITVPNIEGFLPLVAYAAAAMVIIFAAISAALLIFARRDFINILQTFIALIYRV